MPQRTTYATLPLLLLIASAAVAQPDAAPGTSRFRETPRTLFPPPQRTAQSAVGDLASDPAGDLASDLAGDAPPNHSPIRQASHVASESPPGAHPSPPAKGDRGPAAEGPFEPRRLALPDRRDALARDLPTRGAAPSPSPGRSIPAVIAALAGVVALFLGVVWLLRRGAGRGASPLPGDVFEVLGRASLGNKQPVQLIRLGGKLVLVSLSGQGWQTLTEIDDPDEVTRLTGLCRQAQPGSASDAFRRLLQHWGNGPAEVEARAKSSRPSPPAARRVPKSAEEVGDV